MRSSLSSRILILAAIIIAALCGGGYLAWRSSRASTLEFLVRDAVSGQWVWDTTAIVGDREMRLYYQSDQGPATQIFTRLTPGDTVLQISAPSYSPVSIPLTLPRGATSIATPVDLVGYEIPGLARWVMFEEWVGNRIAVEMRPLDAGGKAVVNHPCLDLWVGARVSVQQSSASAVGGRSRGAELFRGEIQWEWDPTPESLFRYAALIPAASIRATSEPVWVIDYLVVVPDPRKIDRHEVKSIMDAALARPVDEVAERLEPLETEGLLRAYAYTSWGVDGGRRD